MRPGRNVACERALLRLIDSPVPLHAPPDGRCWPAFLLEGQVKYSKIRVEQSLNDLVTAGELLMSEAHEELWYRRPTALETLALLATEKIDD